MKVLYIGGTGEISYECVLASAAAGQDVTVFNRSVNDEPLPPGVRQVTGDFNDPATYAKLGRETWDVVCQFLAYEVKHVERDREIFAGKVGQYVFISSTSAYRKPPVSHVLTEASPLGNPFWAYSQAKADMENLLMNWHAGAVLPVTIVRPSHTYRRKWPATFHREELPWRMLNGKPIVSHGDGTSLWTLTHSRDFAWPFIRLLGNHDALGEGFHVTSNFVRTWDEIFLAIGEALGVTPVLVHVPSDTIARYCPDWGGTLLGDKKWSTLFDNSKVRALVPGWTCQIDIPEGMKMIAEHWKKRAGGFRPDAARNAMIDRLAAEQLRLG